jgi:hypothetical protein
VRAQIKNPYCLLFASLVFLNVCSPSSAQDKPIPTATASDGSSTNQPTVIMNMNQSNPSPDSSNNIYQSPIRQQGSISASELEAEKYQRRKKSLFGGIVGGLGKELGSSVEYMGKDAAFVFSAQDYDANKTSAPKGPYQEYHIRWSDGTRSNIVKYPDGKRVITSGYRSGTVITPLNDNTLDIQYTNGHHSTARQTDNGGWVISRYDGKTFRLTPTMDGGFYITGSSGEMGTIEPSVVDTHYGYYSKTDSMDF